MASEVEKIINKVRKTNQNLSLGTTGAGIGKNKVYKLDDAKLLLFYLLYDVGVELGIDFDKVKLCREIWG